MIGRNDTRSNLIPQPQPLPPPQLQSPRTRRPSVLTITSARHIGHSVREATTSSSSSLTSPISPPRSCPPRWAASHLSTHSQHSQWQHSLSCAHRVQLPAVRWHAARLARPIDRVNHEPAANDQVDVVLEHGERHPRQAEAPRLVTADVLVVRQPGLVRDKLAQSRVALAPLLESEQPAVPRQREPAPCPGPLLQPVSEHLPEAHEQGAVRLVWKRLKQLEKCGLRVVEARVESPVV
mmetsp:Transcript_32350/g.105846  ORF Transcript_32350/g.105846 Transcript_32350/m.105846 type:complete len:237 (-) Transcript_32350:569-1279(-)